MTEAGPRLYISDRWPNGVVKVRARHLKADGAFLRTDPWGTFATEAEAHAEAAREGLEIGEGTQAETADPALVRERDLLREVVEADLAIRAAVSTEERCEAIARFRNAKAALDEFDKRAGGDAQ